MNMCKVLLMGTVAKGKYQRTIYDGREYQENENFAPKQDKRDCPLT